jgi:hypothetical protein
MTNQPYCPGFQRWLHGNRRQLLTAGSLSVLGLGSGGFGSLTAAGAMPALPIRAKRCIFLFMWGGPSQLDTFDMKPGAPAEVRGEFKPVSTAVPGIQICEHFTRLASLTDRLTIIRSLGHDDPAHLSSGHATLTGNPAPTLKSDAAQSGWNAQLRRYALESVSSCGPRRRSSRTTWRMARVGLQRDAHARRSQSSRLETARTLAPR